MADSPRIQDLERRVERDPASIAFAQLAEEYRRAGRLDDAVRVCRAGLDRHPSYVSARVTLGRALIGLEQYEDAHAELEAVVQVAPDNLAAIRALAELHQHHGELAVPRERHAEPSPAPMPPPAPGEPTADLNLSSPANDDDLGRALAALDALDLRGLTSSPGDLARADPFEPSELDAIQAAGDFIDGRSSFDPNTALETFDDILPARDEVLEDPPARFTMWTPSVPAEPPSRSDIDDAIQLSEPFEAIEAVEPVDPALPLLESWLAAITADRAIRRVTS